MTTRSRTGPAEHFPPTYRLHNKIEFDLVYRQGRRVNSPYFVAVVRRNELAHGRLGLSISAKAVGNAVARNRVKRMLRESFRRNTHRLPSIDIVINARPTVKNAARETLVDSVTQLWDKLARHA